MPPPPRVEDYDTFIFDCDGVIWKGNKLISGAGKTLEYLREAKKNVFFMTNNSLKTREECIAKFELMGVHIDPSHLLCSGFSAATYLRGLGFSHSEKKVYVIGEKSIVSELNLQGIATIGGPDFNGVNVPIVNDLHVDTDENIAAVVVGCDRDISYYKLLYAQQCFLKTPSCIFVASNTDQVKHLTPTQEFAGAGAMVNAVIGCTGLRPVITGKPSRFMIDYLIDVHGIEPPRTLMVGDRLDTDIAFGVSGGTATCLVLSGCTARAQVEDPKCDIKPDFVVDSIAALLGTS
ncbi:unnamed protein product [Ectocarpus fasciculatus]